jgi:hypothetical protein
MYQNVIFIFKTFCVVKLMNLKAKYQYLNINVASDVGKSFFDSYGLLFVLY